MQSRQIMQGKVYLFLFILFFLTTTVPAGETPDLYKNQLHLQWQIISQLGQSLGCPQGCDTSDTGLNQTPRFPRHSKLHTPCKGQRNGFATHGEESVGTNTLSSSCTTS